jgi:hypothetical protein
VALELDLAPARAKLARAREHVQALQGEATAGVGEGSAYAVLFSKVDPQTGWCSITFVPQHGEKPRLSVILGDVVHNLRCALDYVVTALADASQTKLSTNHQFPIYLDAGLYRKHVGTADRPKGPLSGIKHGLTLIEQWQPYRTQPDPRTAPLWGIHRFSNADKHREPATFGAIPVGSFKMGYSGTIIERDMPEELPAWTPGQELKVGRIRFDPPRAENLRAEGQVALDVRFVTPPFGKDADLTITLRSLPFLVRDIEILLDLFGQL